jgi:hypothetical protein
MSQIFSVILGVSVLALIAGLLYRLFQRDQKGRMASAIVLGLALAVVTVIAPPSTRLRADGQIEEVASVVFCYVCMVLGMMAEYAYAQAERGRRRFKFEPMTFLMPIFASPIVFIPLLTLTIAPSLPDSAISTQKLMVYLVAFQNGFFWRSFFEQRRIAARQSESKQLQAT